MNVGVQLSVPDVLPAPTVKLAPAVITVPAAVNDAMASPSGSEAPTMNWRSLFSQAFCMAGAVTVGARSVQ